jgi:hypothetical protein
MAEAGGGEAAVACKERGPDPTLVRYITGTGLNAGPFAGYFCVYNTSTGLCDTEVLTYDGVGFKDFAESGTLCHGGTFVDYDGTGLRPVSYADTACGAY